MKNLTKKQKIIIGLLIALLLVGSYFWGVRRNQTDQRATEDEIEELREEENKDLQALTGDQVEKPEEEKVVISGISLSSDKEEAKPGETVQFRAEIQGQGDFHKGVHWFLEPGEKPYAQGTTIDDQGLLTIGADEANDKVTVKASPAADTSVYSLKEIKITRDGAPAPKTLTPEERAKVDQEAKEIKDQAIKATSGGKKDRYLTDPTPEGRPEPVEPGDVPIEAETQLTATLSINCSTILDNMDLFDMDKIDVLPNDGVILAPTSVHFSKGESVFDVLQRETRNRGIHMEAEFTPMYNSAYVQGIHNLYEFDCGELSGWMYKVNGWFPNYGCSRYVLEDGDVINWVYTCDLGQDVGDNSMVK